MSNEAATPSNLAIEPEFETFARLLEAGQPQVVWTRLVADLETPVSAALKLVNREPYSFLLESVEGGAVRGRYSVIGFAPDLIWRTNGNRAEINRNPADKKSRYEVMDGDALDTLRQVLAESRIELPAALPPMSAGIFGYMGYDTIRLIEALPNENPDHLGVPDSILIRPTVIVIFDTVKDEMTIVTPVYPGTKTAAKSPYLEASNRLMSVVRALEAPLKHRGETAEQSLLSLEPTSNTTRQRYMAMVRKAKSYIKAGDIFQVVLSQRFSAPFKLPAFALYRALRRTNPSPFLFHLDFGNFSIVGSSPEILVRVRDGEVTVRPIAGTRPRGATPEEDRANGADLLADPKERAEHLMLLDLGRNDVGRVAKPGTVKVTDSFFLEFYSHVIHIVSNVVGQLIATRDSIDALMAGFPAGTVSGAPKVRAMEIIDELEHDKRGPYAGCVGYFSADGEMDTCIVLRTAVVKDDVMYVQAGAGIVADSVPKSEQLECENKAKALFKAAEEAVRFASGQKYNR